LGEGNSSLFKYRACPLERGDNYKTVKGVGIIKHFLLNNYWPRKAEIYMKAF
jgi:hypothetical protein